MAIADHQIAERWKPTVPSRIVLHIGIHKTATTSLQSFLEQQHQVLLGHDVRYISLKRMRNDVTPLICNLSTSSQKSLKRFIDSIQNRTLLLSDENVIGGSQDIIISGDIYIYGENRIRIFCGEQEGRQIDIIIAIRSPGDLIPSMYCEHIRHNEFISFNKYISNFNVYNFSYRKTFSWVFDLPRHVRVHVVPFETSLGGGVHRIAHTVLKVACESEAVEAGTFPETRSRTSFKAEELRLAARIAQEADPRTAQMFLNMLDVRGRRFGSERFSPLATDLLDHLDRVYREDVAAMVTSG